MTLYKNAKSGTISFPAVKRVTTCVLCSLFLLPGYAAASDNYLENFADNIDFVSVYTSFYSRHFSPEPDHINDQDMLGIEMRLANKWLYGVTLFDNSFGQQWTLPFYYS
jgi:hypothetical protein